jgi:endogenous inhibitor of DNA gyrase (YacG/DUF329 family)
MDAEGLANWPAWPFCSSRCQLIDLGRWLDGSYAIPPAADAEDPAALEDDAQIP